MKGRYLITTADEQSWKFDRPVLFLGEWCRRYDRKQLWVDMDAAVARPYGLQPGQQDRDITYVQLLSSRLLIELADLLNVFHGTHHSVRYWEILLGHWLQRYVAVAFNRYYALEQALNEHEVSGTTIFDSKAYSLATKNSMAFIWACSDDVWNHVFYSKILDYWGMTRKELDTERIAGVAFFAMEECSIISQQRAKRRLILNVVNKILHKLSHKHDAVIINSFLPLKEEIKLQLSLGQFPQLWESPRPQFMPPDQDQRQRLRIDTANHGGFERFVRLQLTEVLPTCYLEGYRELQQQVDSLPLPGKPRFIFTSNSFDTDELFKAWTASKVDQGVPYFTGQHGSNYGTHKYFGNQYWPELSAPDRFFTWGWTNGNPRNVPAFVFNIVGRKPKKNKLNGGLLLVEVHVPHRLVPEDSYYEFGQYQENQFRFVEALPESIRQQLTVRLYGGYKKFSWGDELRWLDRSGNTMIDVGDSDIRTLIASSRLVVYSYNSTGLLESLAMNIPAMCFWKGGLDQFLPEARSYYKLLNDVGVLVDSPELAAELISLRWENIISWWESKKVQDARREFCAQHARTVKHPVTTLKQLLTTNA